MIAGSVNERRETDPLTISRNPNPVGTETLKALYDECYDRIYAYCVHRLYCRTTAEDVTGQVFLCAARKIGHIQDKPRPVQVKWLYVIATNECNAYLRRHINRRKLFEQYQKEYILAGPEETTAPDWTRVYRAMAQLKAVEQTVITLRFFERMDHERIAAIVGKRQASVRVILHRGLGKLRRLLNSDWQAEETRCSS